MLVILKNTSQTSMGINKSSGLIGTVIGQNMTLNELCLWLSKMSFTKRNNICFPEKIILTFLVNNFKQGCINPIKPKYVNRFITSLYRLIMTRGGVDL